MQTILIVKKVLSSIGSYKISFNESQVVPSATTEHDEPWSDEEEGLTYHGNLNPQGSANRRRPYNFLHNPNSFSYSDDEESVAEGGHGINSDTTPEASDPGDEELPTGK
jgi:hypothetical protein